MLKPLLVSWAADWASCDQLTRWILASWLVVTRQLPDSLRPDLGLEENPDAVEEPEDPEEAALVESGEVVESDDEDIQAGGKKNFEPAAA